MQERTRLLLEQHVKDAARGYMGPAVELASAQYGTLSDTQLLAQFIFDYYKEATAASPQEQQVHETTDLFIQLLLASYRMAARTDIKVARGFAESLTEDYGGVEDSHLLPQWAGLSEATLAFKTSILQSKRQTAWPIYKDMFLAYHEFASGLLGFLILMHRAAQGKKVNPNVLTGALGAKLNEFMELTGADDGAFYLLGRILKPEIRNAIAHKDFWQDDKDVLHYVVSKQPRQEKTVTLLEFSGFSLLGANLGRVYILALCVLALWTSNDTADRKLIPQHLVRVLSHT